MSKQTISKLDPQAVQDSLNKQHLGIEETDAISTDEGFALMESMDSSQLQDLTSEYFKFEKKGKFFFIFTGMTTADIDNKNIPVVMLEDKEGTKFINGNAVVVNSLKKVDMLPCYVRFDYEADVKSAKGTYKDIKVYTFPMKPKVNTNRDAETNKKLPF